MAKPVPALRPRYEPLPHGNSTGSPKQVKTEAPHLHRDSKHTVSPVAAPRGSKTLNAHIDKNVEEMQIDLGLKDPMHGQSPVRTFYGALDQRSNTSLREATRVKNGPAVANLTTPSKEMPDLGSSRTLNGSPVLMKTPEVRLNKVSSPITKTPTQRIPRELQLGSSPTLNGSPVSLKTPELHLSRVDSPIATASTRSLDIQRGSQELKHAQSSQPAPPPEPQQQQPLWNMQMQPTPVAQASAKENLQHAQSPPRYPVHPDGSPVQHLGASPSALSPQDHRGSPFQQRTSPHQLSPNLQHQQPNPGIQMPTLRHMSEQVPQQMYLQQQQLQQQQQQQQQALMQAQQQAMLQHYSPQKLHQSHSPAGLRASEQQQRQAQALLQHRALEQQQMMLQQAHAQQQYLMQQARMGNQQALLSHPPSVHSPSVHSYYAANPGMHPHNVMLHAGSPSKQVPQHQAHLGSHINNLQRLAQEPSRTSLSPLGMSHGHIAAPPLRPMNPYSNPYAQYGSNIQPGAPNPATGRLNHYNPHGVMPGR